MRFKNTILILFIVIINLSFLPLFFAQDNAPISSISLGANHSCILFTDGQISCWGDNEYGQLGDGTKINKNSPAIVSGITNAKNISLGQDHSCALLEDSTIKCWGKNTNGQLGNDTIIDSAFPVIVSEISNVKSISLGANHSCALLSNEKISCWGANKFGQLGDGTTIDRKKPTPVLKVEDIKSISLGFYHSCALSKTEEDIFCWGLNGTGQLGLEKDERNNVIIDDAETNILKTPVEISYDLVFQKISLGGRHTCVLATDGNAYCWGHGSSYELGFPVHIFTHRYGKVAYISYIKDIALGYNHSCALLEDKTVKCWGSNLNGKLGTTVPVHSFVESIVSNLTSVKGLSLGFNHSCALLEDDTVKCWGDNSFGQLGNGTITSSYIPVSVIDILKTETENQTLPITDSENSVIAQNPVNPQEDVSEINDFTSETGVNIIGDTRDTQKTIALKDTDFIYELNSQEYIACKEGKLSELLNLENTSENENDFYLDNRGEIPLSLDNTNTKIVLTTQYDIYKVCVNIKSLNASQNNHDIAINQNFLFKKSEDAILKEKEGLFGLNERPRNIFSRFGNWVSDILKKDKVILTNIKVNYNAQINIDKTKIPIFKNGIEQKTVNLQLADIISDEFRYDIKEKAFVGYYPLGIDNTEFSTLKNYSVGLTFIKDEETTPITIDDDLEISIISNYPNSNEPTLKFKITDLEHFKYNKEVSNITLNNGRPIDIYREKIITTRTGEHEKIAEVIVNFSVNLQDIDLLANKIVLEENLTTRDFIYNLDADKIGFVACSEKPIMVTDGQYIKGHGEIPENNSIASTITFKNNEQKYNICVYINKAISDIQGDIYTNQLIDYYILEEKENIQTLPFKVLEKRSLFGINWFIFDWLIRDDLKDIIRMQLNAKINFNKLEVPQFRNGIQEKDVLLDLDDKFNSSVFRIDEKTGKFSGCISGYVKDVEDIGRLYYFDSQNYKTYIKNTKGEIRKADIKIEINFKEKYEYQVCAIVDSPDKNNYGIITEFFTNPNNNTFVIKNTEVVTNNKILAIFLLGLNNILAADSEIANIKLKLDANLENLKFNTNDLVLVHNFTTPDFYYNITDKSFVGCQLKTFDNLPTIKEYIPNKTIGQFFNQERNLGAIIYFQAKEKTDYKVCSTVYRDLDDITGDIFKQEIDGQFVNKQTPESNSSESENSTATGSIEFNTNKIRKFLWFDFLWPDKKNVSQVTIKLDSDVDFNKLQVPRFRGDIQEKDVYLDLGNTFSNLAFIKDEETGKYRGCIKGNYSDIKDLITIKESKENLVNINPDNIRTKGLQEVNSGYVIKPNYNIELKLLRSEQYSMCLITFDTPEKILSTENISDLYLTESDNSEPKIFKIYNKSKEVANIKIKININKLLERESASLTRKFDLEDYVEYKGEGLCFDPKGFNEDYGKTGLIEYMKYGFDKILFEWSESQINYNSCDYGENYCDQDQFRLALNKKIKELNNNNYIELEDIKFKLNDFKLIELHLARPSILDSRLNPAVDPVIDKSLISEYQDNVFKINLQPIDERNINTKDIITRLKNDLNRSVPKELQKLTIMRIDFDSSKKQEYLLKTTELLNNESDIYVIDIDKKSYISFTANNFLSSTKPHKENILPEDAEYMLEFLSSLDIYYGVTLNPSLVNLKPFGDLTGETNDILTEIYFLSDREDYTYNLDATSEIKNIDKPNVYFLYLENIDDFKKTASYKLSKLSDTSESKINIYENRTEYKDNLFFTTNINARYNDYGETPFDLSITQHAKTKSSNIKVYSDYSDLLNIQEGYIYKLKTTQNGQIQDSQFADVIPLQITSKDLTGNSFSIDVYDDSVRGDYKKSNIALRSLIPTSDSVPQIITTHLSSGHTYNFTTPIKTSVFVFNNFKDSGNKPQMLIESEKELYFNLLDTDSRKESRNNKIVYSLPSKLETLGKYQAQINTSGFNYMIYGATDNPLVGGIRYPSILNNHICFRFENTNNEKNFYLWSNPAILSGKTNNNPNIFVIKTESGEYYIDFSAGQGGYYIAEKKD